MRRRVEGGLVDRGHGGDDLGMGLGGRLRIAAELGDDAVDVLAQRLHPLPRHAQVAPGLVELGLGDEALVAELGLAVVHPPVVGHVLREHAELHSFLGEGGVQCLDLVEAHVQVGFRPLQRDPEWLVVEAEEELSRRDHVVLGDQHLDHPLGDVRRDDDLVGLDVRVVAADEASAGDVIDRAGGKDRHGSEHQQQCPREGADQAAAPASPAQRRYDGLDVARTLVRHHVGLEPSTPHRSSVHHTTALRVHPARRPGGRGGVPRIMNSGGTPMTPGAP